MDRELIKKEPLKRTRSRKGLFTRNSHALLSREASEVRKMVEKMNAQADPLHLAESYEQAAISYIKSFGYEYKKSGQKTIKVSKEKREQRLQAYNESIRKELNLKCEEGPLTIDNIEKEDVVSWWGYLYAESEKQGNHGIRYALDVIGITTQIKNGLEKGNYNNLFNLAMKLTNCFSIMVIAQCEDRICAGASRANIGSTANRDKAEKRKLKAIELAKEFRTRNSHKKVTKEEVYRYISKQLGVSRASAKGYLKKYFLDFPIK
ncbi:hypothetical protein WL045_20670 [Vibrio alginolyticus]|uniref:hypothetical protein n=1 Tax=Vibrio alginolyticus TaxID=663 RepID=UPI00375410E0